MKTSAFLFGFAAAGIVFGAYLIGMWCVGLAVIVDSLAVAGFALLRDIPEKRPALSPVAEILENARRRA